MARAEPELSEAETLKVRLATLQAVGWDCYLHSIVGADGKLKPVLVVTSRGTRLKT